ncbi:Hsp20/alpha crystallin family protein [methanotrophic endosymbiont of Bathymodiolus puteoserpentis (Logatchev)]|uniref:Hsp20/alpha crystallin family protein n=1 Tax=methanotrophic endosymbiont of Bathymodiolus puteoserpentis (Logatchev) TaxID=343235 RepID=UPI00157A6762|nr:Hsp20/alpha crystallin family protein [methanotrophic endosymbiont of Bathymodiolus puteoserpentis (Logatchev)]
MISNMLRFPFSMLDNEMESLFYPEVYRSLAGHSQLTYPPINISTTDKSVDVYLFIAGMNPDDIELVIEKNMLSVSGTRKLPDAQGDDKGSYRQERFEGSFKRVITLPETVDTESPQAVYKDGVLHITIAKRAETQPRQIKISAQ